MNKVKIHDLEKVLEPLFYNWKRKRQSKESFGDFTNRVVSIEITTLQVIISQPI
jgi:sulfite reductase beta subunit-like hemoprotein